MSIKITISAPGLTLGANLKDESLAELIRLIQQYRDEEIGLAVPLASNAQSEVPITDGITGKEPNSDKVTVGSTEDDVKRRLNELAAGELLNMLNWTTFSEKILVLGAWGEARGVATPWKKEDVEGLFQQAKERPPANFARDVSGAIKSGWIHAETPRTYSITRSGWNRLGAALT